MRTECIPSPLSCDNVQQLHKSIVDSCVTALGQDSDTNSNDISFGSIIHTLMS